MPTNDPELLLPLKRLAAVLHETGLDGRGRRGKPLHVSRLLRYATKGKRVGDRVVRLVATRLPSGWHCSVGAWRRYTAELTAASLPVAPPAPSAARPPAKRQSAVEAAIAELRAGLRRPAVPAPGVEGHPARGREPEGCQ